MADRIYFYYAIITLKPLMFTIGSIMAYQSLGTTQEGPPGPPPPPGVLTAWLTCLGVLALTLLISFLTYRLVEVPARRWINGKSDRLGLCYSRLIGPSFSTTTLLV